MTYSDTATYMTLDVSIVKSPQQQLGIVFRQEFVADRYQVCSMHVPTITNILCSGILVLL